VRRQSAPSSGTLAAVVNEYFRSAAFAKLAKSSQATYRFALDPVIKREGSRLLSDLRRGAAREIIQEIGNDKPAMANLTCGVMSAVFDCAIAIDLCDDNPCHRIERYKIGTHHTWTEAEIVQFERRGLPNRCVPHGLRKAACRRLAEVGATAHQIMAVSGHKSLREVERYTRAARP
jgi:hypothetical protein